MTEIKQKKLLQTRVFISYPRKDAAFAELLEQGLDCEGFEAFRDVKDIGDVEAWRERLEVLIQRAHAVVFVRLEHDRAKYGPSIRAAFTSDEVRLLTWGQNGTARVWDMTWATGLTETQLVRAVAHHRFAGAGQLTDAEVRRMAQFAEPLPPDQRDVVARVLANLPARPEVNGKIERIVTQWRRESSPLLRECKNEKNRHP